ncbi:MAG TPA: hypothetical protein VNI77_01500 [Nitrososphaera sp.]|nr:hypothetical protein [Nitrososphaera sp.]
MSQFTCKICGDGFDQKPRLDLHMTMSHHQREHLLQQMLKNVLGLYNIAKQRKNLSIMLQV